MELWYAIPSCNVERAENSFAAWKLHGCRTAVLIDKGGARPPSADLVLEPDQYPGYFTSVNLLCRAIIEQGNPTLIITGGDDILPDAKFEAPQLAEQFLKRFPDGFGVMQPTGDPMPGTDQICGSPWMGMGWVKRANQGHGPFHGGYQSFFGDQEMKVVAEILDVLWMRDDVAQFHDHPMRGGGRKMTDYQKRNQTNWRADRELYNTRAAANFPGSNPLH